jgi:calcineurin-like phosphoesterase family protein/purple acid phosphatase-like protein
MQLPSQRSRSSRQPDGCVRALAVAVVLSIAARAGAQIITRGPFIQNPDAQTTTMTLEWWTDAAGDSTVEYGTTVALGSSVNAPTTGSCEIGSAGTCHIVPLTGLLPGARYYYQLKTNGTVVQAAAPNIYFTTLKDPTDTNDLFFTVFGDWGQDSSQEQQVSNNQNAADPPLLMTVGDNAYQNGTQSDWDNNALAYYVNPMMRMLFMPTLGNHDLNDVGPSNWANSVEIKLFLLPRDGTAQERYYSFDDGDAHFIVLDANAPTDSTQRAWLESNLAGTPRRWKFVFLHQTPYSCANGLASIGSDSNVRSNWGPLFEQYGVDIVFDGHDHIYERTNYLDDFGSDGLGTTYIMTGGGGASLDSTAKVDSSGNAYRQPFEPFGSRTYCYWLAHNCPGGPSNYCSFARFHHVAVHVTNNTSLQLQAIDNNGNVFDTFSINKAVPTATPTNTPTATLLPTLTPTDTPTLTLTPTITPTPVPPTPTAPPGCQAAAPVNPCVPAGGGSKRGCNLEWIAPSGPVFLRKGIPTNKIICSDGNPYCDFDATENQRCTFHVTMCINASDPRLGSCVQPDLQSLEVTRPSLTSTDPVDIAIRTAIEGQAGAGGFGLTVLRGDTTVFSGTVNATPDLCSAPLTIEVPRPTTSSTAVGKKTVRVRGTTSAGKRFNDSLKFECWP